MAKEGNFTADGVQGLTVTGAHQAVIFNTLYAKFNAGTGLLKVQVSPDGVNWFDAHGGISETGIVNFQARFKEARLQMSNSAGVDVDWWVL